MTAPEKKVVSVRIEADLWRSFRAAAAKNGKTVTWLIEDYVRRYVEMKG